MNKPTVTVAIPAYNEEKSILKILESIYLQKRRNYTLSDVKVYSDGSTDSMVSLIKSNLKAVIVVDSKINIGKNRRINQIMKENSSDILIQADADIKLSNDSVFDNLVEPLAKNSKIGISCAYHLASKPKYFVERLAYFGFKVWDNARISLGKKGVRYYCEGGLRAFSNKFTKEFRIPLVRGVSEDSYSFYWAVKNEHKVVVNKVAKVYIDLPANYSDYARQMKRFLSDPVNVTEAFGKDLTHKYETMNSLIKIRALIAEFMKSPFTGMGYILLQLLVKLQFLFYKADTYWVPIKRR